MEERIVAQERAFISNQSKVESHHHYQIVTSPFTLPLSLSLSLFTFLFVSLSLLW